MNERLKEIGRLIRDQDNRATELPIFIVQQKRRIYGIDSQFCDESNIAWLFDGDEITGKERDDLEAKYQETGDECDYTRTGYIDIWEFVTACFTEQGCKEYIASNGHNLKETRIYAASGYRNQEWRDVRDFLRTT